MYCYIDIYDGKLNYFHNYCAFMRVAYGAFTTIDELEDAYHEAGVGADKEHDFLFQDKEVLHQMGIELILPFACPWEN